MTYKGVQGSNEAAPYLSEYISRKRLAKLGFTSPISELTYQKAEMFCLIDSELDKHSKAEMEAKSKAVKRGSKR